MGFFYFLFVCFVVVVVVCFFVVVVCFVLHKTFLFFCFFLIAILCPELVAPGNGSVNVSARAVSSAASYSCIDGFLLEGQRHRTCLENGTWTGTNPSCTRK